ncbi:MAG TPA: glycosyltransferase [Vicinamibacterales bacterium]|nr:glycosyltransferase [Vicinamibacterales bacterium]
MPEVSIVIPVFDKLEFTRQCLDRIWRNTSHDVAYEVIVVDNGSTDGTTEWFADISRFPGVLRYHRNDRNLGYARANNIGARLARGTYLLFLNNDTLVQPGWLEAMLRIAKADPAVGVVGIKQLFPYTNVVYHTGIVFAPGGLPQHLYPHLDASLPCVNKEREYQAVTGSCLLIERSLFERCGGFDERYLNGYEDIDLCLSVREHGRKVVCCTRAYIYHYGQISEGRAADDDRNAELFARKWAGRVRVDQAEYFAADGFGARRKERPSAGAIRRLGEDCLYFADDLGQGSALTWMTADLVLSLAELGVPVFVRRTRFSPTLPAAARKRLSSLALDGPPAGGVQIKWSHYWPQHLTLELAGDINLELFVINYIFGRPGSEPWDYWLQCLRQNHHAKLPLSEFCRSVLRQIGIPDTASHVLHPGYAREMRDVEPPRRRDSTFRFLTVTNSHDLPRYGTLKLIEAYREAFRASEDVLLVIKDYGASSGDDTLRRALQGRAGPRIQYVEEFMSRLELARLYKSCDAYVSAHRGEGFGIKILDAMACGLPVIAPLFGGPADYCSEQTCFPVEYSLEPMGDCLDARSLAIANQPMWAEPDTRSLADQMRRVYERRDDACRVALRARDVVLENFSWERASTRLLDIVEQLRAERPRPTRARPAPAGPPAERSPYWLGVRVSVVVPTHNRRDKLLNCLDALARQSILPQEFEVLVVDDGSTDGTDEAVQARRYPFRLRYYRQERQGPGAARNLGLEHAEGELVLFTGDDIVADPRLLEEHLLAHAGDPDPGVAVLGHIDWAPWLRPNAVMRYACGDAGLQFAYDEIRRLPDLDHRFFYTSNISLKRAFLAEAAAAGIRFDPCFRHAAFEDSEFAYRLRPRGLRIRYHERARALHDHWVDLQSFAERERSAGRMAVVFFRKHPDQDGQLQVRRVADLVRPAAELLEDPALLDCLEAFDRETDALLRALAASLEALIALRPRSETDRAGSVLREKHLEPALHRLFETIFDVERTRGKLEEWFSGAGDEKRLRAAQVLGAVRRKMEFLARDAGLPALAGAFDRRLAAGALPHTVGSAPDDSRRLRLAGRLIGSPSLRMRLLGLDRFIQTRLRVAAPPGWLDRYMHVRARVRDFLL